MGIPHSITKQLAAAQTGNIVSTSNPGTGFFTLTGGTSATLLSSSQATNAATAAGLGIAGGTTLTFASVPAAVAAGQSVVDNTTAGAIPAGAYVLGKSATTVTISAPVGGAGVGSGDTITFGSLFGGGVLLDTQRRLLFTPGGSDAAINYIITGLNDAGQPIGETLAGVASPATVASVLDYRTVLSIKGSGAVQNGIQVGTNTTGATPWLGVNWHAQPFSVEMAGIVAAGQTVTWGWQYTHDDPNNLPFGIAAARAFDHPILNNQASTTLDAPTNEVVAAIRMIVIAGIGTVTGTWQEAGISGQ